MHQTKFLCEYWNFMERKARYVESWERRGTRYRLGSFPSNVECVSFVVLFYGPVIEWKIRCRWLEMCEMRVRIYAVIFIYVPSYWSSFFCGDVGLLKCRLCGAFYGLLEESILVDDLFGTVVMVIFLNNTSSFTFAPKLSNDACWDFSFYFEGIDLRIRGNEKLRKSENEKSFETFSKIYLIIENRIIAINFSSLENWREINLYFKRTEK